MKVILLQDVKKVGKKGEVVEVADGYGRNFLIMRGLAVMESSGSKKVLDAQKKQEAILDEENRNKALQLKKTLETIVLEFKLKSNNGRTNGSVSLKQIEEALKNKGLIIDKRKIKDCDKLNEFGTYDIKIELYKDVIGNIKVKLIEE